ncbi:Crp/Fnr family transcriptional regulator [Micromonospora sp. WMMA1923]|uniref:Crp/Fnr family transcriptional regulator n=1 Tax=Micromonospora sp. WMMA1923 TaxID=3404125 RepID=UPI003B927BAC
MQEKTWLAGTFLGRLSHTARKQLFAAGVRRSVREAQVVLREGDLETYVVVLEDALAKVTAAMSDGRQALLAIRMSGDIVGETSAINATPRTATVTACRRSTIQIVHRDAFRAFLHANPEAAMEVAGIVADRLRWADTRRVDFASCSVKVRLARVLLEIAVAYGRRSTSGVVIGVGLSQAEMATLCGAAEITVQKAVSSLRKAGIVATGYREIIVRDIDGLREVAEVDLAH